MKRLVYIYYMNTVLGKGVQKVVVLESYNCRNGMFWHLQNKIHFPSPSCVNIGVSIHQFVFFYTL